MKTLLNVVLTVIILAGGVYLLKALWPPTVDPLSRSSSGSAGEKDTGPRGGHWLESGELGLEITINENGIPPEFRVYAYRNDQALDPNDISLKIRLSRLGGDVDEIRFIPRDDYLVGDQTVREPHSFEVRVDAEHNRTPYVWEYSQHEGRTRISADVATAAGIETAIAGPAEIKQMLEVQGEIRGDPGRIRQLRPRYPGIIRTATGRIGLEVKRGQTLAIIESNDSLEVYELTAPISGTIIAQQAAMGESVNDQPIFTIANLERVWADLAVFPGDREYVMSGQAVAVKLMGGTAEKTSSIDHLLPISDRHSRTTVARVIIDNTDGFWQPGMAVSAAITLTRETVPLAVRNSALQSFRDFDVVYARFDDDYEVRVLQLGMRDDTHTEVINGVSPGTEYVVGNSFLIKADIEKSGAAHGH